MSDQNQGVGDEANLSGAALAQRQLAKAAAAQRLVGFQYTVGFDLGNGRQIQINGNFYKDDTPADMNAAFDQLMVVLERQRAKCEIPLLEAEARTREKLVVGMQEQIIRLEVMASKHKGGLNPANMAALENHRVNLKRAEQDFADGLKAIEDAKRKAA